MVEGVVLGSVLGRERLLPPTMGVGGEVGIPPRVEEEDLEEEELVGEVVEAGATISPRVLGLDDLLMVRE